MYMTAVNSFFSSFGANGLRNIAVKLCRVACHNTSEIGGMGGMGLYPPLLPALLKALQVPLNPHLFLPST